MILPHGPLSDLMQQFAMQICNLIVSAFKLIPF
jgi:hypothetical protein